MFPQLPTDQLCTFAHGCSPSAFEQKCVLLAGARLQQHQQSREPALQSNVAQPHREATGKAPAHQSEAAARQAVPSRLAAASATFSQSAVPGARASLQSPIGQLPHAAGMRHDEGMQGSGRHSAQSIALEEQQSEAPASERNEEEQMQHEQPNVAGGRAADAPGAHQGYGLHSPRQAGVTLASMGSPNAQRPPRSAPQAKRKRKSSFVEGF